jgi:hypothetical protein
LYKPCSAACPRAHKLPCPIGSAGFPSSFTTRPSRIRATTPHPAGHSAQVVAKKLGMPGTTFSSGTTYGISLRAAGSHPGIALAAVAVAASLMNARLDIEVPSRVGFFTFLTQ